MQCQLLSSGSAGNSILLRAGESHLLVDAGLPTRELHDRLRAARVPFRGIEHVLVTHAHLDHARSAGAIARRHGATVHCAQAMMGHRSVKRAPRLEVLRIGTEHEITGRRGESVSYRAVPLPHDCAPTVAFAIAHGGRRVAVLTDMGSPRDEVAAALRDAHVLVLEFNHDARMLRDGQDPEALKRRIGSSQGHLDNDQAARMLEGLVGPATHTVVLAHLSRRNNTPDLARAAAERALGRSGRRNVRVLLASQHEVGPAIDV